MSYTGDRGRSAHPAGRSLEEPSQPSLFVVAPTIQHSDERFTPPWLFRALGETYDLDVAAPVGGGDYVPALARWTRNEDGLAQPWHGFIWCNPPFSNTAEWVDRFIEHGNGIFLGPIAGTVWTTRLAAAADRYWIVRPFKFLNNDTQMSAGRFAIVIAGIGERAARAIDRASELGVEGVVLTPRNAAVVLPSPCIVHLNGGDTRAGKQ